MAYREEEDLRREFERLRAQAMRSMMPMPFYGMNPVFPDPFPGILRPTPPIVPPPTYDEVELDPEEAVMRRVMEESRRAEEQRRKKEEEERKRREREEQMNLDYLAQEDDEMLQQSLLASLATTDATQQPASSPALTHMEEGYEEDEATELRKALELSMKQGQIEAQRKQLSAAAAEPEAEKKREEERIRKEEEERRMRDMGLESQNDEDDEMMQAIAASLQVEQEAKKKRDEEKKRRDAARLDEQVRRLMGSMGGGVFEAKETDLPYGAEMSEEERREKLKRQAEIDERQLLRDQQDEEFRASLARDRFLENERRQQEAKEAQERREREMQEAEARRRKEELERKEQARIEEMQAKGATLPEEPQEKDPNGTALSCRLPSGNRFKRRFRKDTTLAVVKNWVDSVLVEEIIAKQKEEVEAEEQKDGNNNEENKEEEGKGELYGYNLVTFPNRTFNDLSMTLEEAGLGQSALISVVMH